MASTANVNVSDTAWTLLYTAGAAVTASFEVVATGNLLLHIGSDPGAGDASRVGRVVVPGYHRGSARSRADLTLANTNTVYGRLDRGTSGKVTVIG